ncbi:uncharacterized protein HemX [Desulfobaculum xiamenense]|uniref:Uncharacterized protein HemX n=1 Tax=Desulfobaculum xiamenense TaxID=995050 RepID=A0A846QPB0_9BACT|nr:hypothetical protein [Desulfobaculum xiamenense]NJB67054.1 uncharacterized protein HemX [Desulfobaculum xiamenense]
MNPTLTLLLIMSITEFLLLGLLLVFFLRLRRSESALNTLQQKQESILAKLHFNAELEQELVSTFAKRQSELSQLDNLLEERAKDLRKLVRQAEEISRSPQFLREVIISGRRKGKSPQALALTTGLSVDEVELILEQAGL